ncbi:MAG: ester cyclase [Chloroflexota bacterium]
MNANKDLVRRWVDVFNRQDLDACSELAADAYVEHAIAPFGRQAPGRVNGPAHLRETAEWLVAQFPDVQMTIDELVADGEIVAARITSTGTNLGPLNGMMPPTGRTFTSQQSHWFRITDGKLAEHWANREDLVAMLQLGVIVPPGRPT